VTFSDDLEELQRIVKKLEDSPLSLEEALSDFQKGLNLVRQCQQFLVEAEQKITTLSESDDEAPGEPFGKQGTGESLL
jgi:exodeoxyribonuclease VII small subunit